MAGAGAEGGFPVDVVFGEADMPWPVAAHWADLAKYLRAAAREGDAMLLWIS